MKFSVKGDVLRGYINYLEHSCSDDAKLSRSDLRSKLIEGGFPKNMNVDQHIEKVRAIFLVLSVRDSVFDLMVQLVPLLNAYDGMFPVSGLLATYKQQLEFVEGAELLKAVSSCKCSIS